MVIALLFVGEDEVEVKAKVDRLLRGRSPATAAYNYTTAKTIFFLPRTHDLVRFFSENINKCLLIGY
jgi:hypothetical protein